MGAPPATFVKRRWSRRFLLGAGLLAAAYAASAAYCVRRGYRECHPPRSRVSAEQASEAKQRLPDLRDLELTTQEGLRLKAWFVPPRNGNVMVLVTGLGGNRSSLLDEAELFARHGYGSLLLEQRAHGDSEGDTATWGDREADDVVRAVKRAYEEPGVSAVGALGFSVGASVVALAAIQEPRIRVVVLYATWTSLREEVAYKASKRLPHAGYWTRLGYSLAGVNVDRVAPEPQMKRISPRPLLLLSGAMDTDTPPTVMDRIQAASADGTELWRLPGVGHGGYLQASPAEYERRVVGFLDRGFAAGRAH